MRKDVTSSLGTNSTSVTAIAQIQPQPTTKLAQKMTIFPVPYIIPHVSQLQAAPSNPYNVRSSMRFGSKPAQIAHVFRIHQTLEDRISSSKRKQQDIRMTTSMKIHSIVNEQANNKINTSNIIEQSQKLHSHSSNSHHSSDVNIKPTSSQNSNFNNVAQNVSQIKLNNNNNSQSGVQQQQIQQQQQGSRMRKHRKEQNSNRALLQGQNDSLPPRPQSMSEYDSNTSNSAIITGGNRDNSSMSSHSQTNNRSNTNISSYPESSKSRVFTAFKDSYAYEALKQQQQQQQHNNFQQQINNNFQISQHQQGYPPPVPNQVPSSQQQTQLVFQPKTHLKRRFIIAQESKLEAQESEFFKQRNNKQQQLHQQQQQFQKNALSREIQDSNLSSSSMSKEDDLAESTRKGSSKHRANHFSRIDLEGILNRRQQIMQEEFLSTSKRQNYLGILDASISAVPPSSTSLPHNNILSTPTKRSSNKRSTTATAVPAVAVTATNGVPNSSVYQETYNSFGNHRTVNDSLHLSSYKQLATRQTTMPSNLQIPSKSAALENNNSKEITIPLDFPVQLQQQQQQQQQVLDFSPISKSRVNGSSQSSRTSSTFLNHNRKVQLQSLKQQGEQILHSTEISSLNYFDTNAMETAEADVKYPDSTDAINHTKYYSQNSNENSNQQQYCSQLQLKRTTSSKEFLVIDQQQHTNKSTLTENVKPTTAIERSNQTNMSSSLHNQKNTKHEDSQKQLQQQLLYQQYRKIRSTTLGTTAWGRHSETAYIKTQKMIRPKGLSPVPPACMIASVIPGPKPAVNNAVYEAKNLKMKLKRKPPLSQQPLNGGSVSSVISSNQQQQSNKKQIIVSSSSAKRIVANPVRAVVSICPGGGSPAAPDVSSKGWAILSCLSDGVEGSEPLQILQLQAKSGSFPVEVASLTKIMTCYLTIMFFEQHGLNMNKVYFEVSSEATEMIGTSANLIKGDFVSAYELLFGLMLPSGNDAAVVLSEGVGYLLLRLESSGSAQEISLANLRGDCVGVNAKLKKEVGGLSACANAFMREMNRFAKVIGMEKTTYACAHGLPNRSNVSSARDIGVLSCVAMQHALFAKVVNTQEYDSKFVLDSTLEFEDQYEWENTNFMLEKNGYDGVKTGVTDSAGPCLSTSYKTCRNGKNLRIVCVLLNCKSMDDRWIETKDLVQWALKNFHAQNE